MTTVKNEDMFSTERFLARVSRPTLEHSEAWLKWLGMIPYMTFPIHWQIAMSPPFCGAIVRFRVRTKEMKKGNVISIYLDCLDALGSVGHPYWEVYPVDGDTFRCGIDETDELLYAIQKGIDCAEKEDKD